jgi:glucokinase
MPEASGKSDYVIGVDLGGTKIQAGVFDGRLFLAGRAKLSTKAQRGTVSVIERIARCIKDAADECDVEFKRVRAVGIGAPGAIDPEAGRVIFAPNLGWKDVALQGELEERLNVPVFLENDCNLGVMGVHAYELKGKPRHLVGIFIGTGIGGGIIVDGKLCTGQQHTAGEIGHMIIQAGGPKCACGNLGCFEALASRTAIFRKLLAAVKAGQKSVLTETRGDELKDLRSGDLRRALRRGDKLVAQLVQEAAYYIGIAVANLINLLNPEIVALGGGVIEALESEMIPVVVKVAREHVLSGTFKDIEIMASRLGDNAAIVGGAMLASRRVAGRAS